MSWLLFLLQICQCSPSKKLETSTTYKVKVILKMFAIYLFKNGFYQLFGIQFWSSIFKHLGKENSQYMEVTNKLKNGEMELLWLSNLSHFLKWTFEEWKLVSQ